MKKTFRTILDNVPGFLRFVMAALVIVFISFLFPNNVKFKYEFKEGQAWKGEDLEAPFDFAVIKSNEELDEEINKLKQEFNPYYVLDESVKTRQQTKFTDEFQQELLKPYVEDQFAHVVKNARLYSEYGKSFLDSLYSRGILELYEGHQTQEKDFTIDVVTAGKVVQPASPDNFMNPDKAKELISDLLPYSPLQDPDFLLPLLENAISPNIIYSDSLTESLLQMKIDEVPKYRGKVSQGELIVSRGTIITDEIYQKLVSYKVEYENNVTKDKSSLWVWIGYFMLTSLIIGVFLMFLKVHSKEIFMSFRQLTFMFLWIVAYSFLVYQLEIQSDVVSLYMIPFCIVPIVIKNFYNARLALFTHIIIILIASFLSSLGYEFTFIQILAGIVAVLANTRTRYWSKFFVGLSYIFFTYCAAYIGLSLIQEGSFLNIQWLVLAWIALNIFLTLLAYPLIPLMEKIFGYTSDLTLVELADLDRPLLKELSLKAPGTLQHSLQVANLSEAAASKIGANALLVKVAALYHDIGKMKQPQFYIENAKGGNPHDSLNNHKESAKIIIEHVTEGVKMAKKAGLPKLIIDFIASHHGTTRVEYFYRSYMKGNPDLDVDEKDFRYPGPNPVTKEQTILMIADSLEAASKSLKSPSYEDINDLTDKIIAGKISHGQLEQSELTFEELEICKDSFKKLLSNIYHVRIAYPKEEKNKGEGSK